MMSARQFFDLELFSSTLTNNSTLAVWKKVSPRLALESTQWAEMIDPSFSVMVHTGIKASITRAFPGTTKLVRNKITLNARNPTWKHVIIDLQTSKSL